MNLSSCHRQALAGPREARASFYRWADGGAERLGALPWVTQWINIYSRVQRQPGLAPQTEHVLLNWPSGQNARDAQSPLPELAVYQRG